MIKILSNICLIVCITTCAVGVSFAVSFTTAHWHWFGRSGAIVTMAGVILSVRPLIRLGFSEWLRSLSIIDCGHAAPTQEEIEAAHQSELDAKASSIGIYLALIGTLIWAYGDLLGGVP